jgi:hypothetical protein
MAAASFGAFLLCCCFLARAAAAQSVAGGAPKPAHSNEKSKNKVKVALPICAAGASTATTTYSCNTYGQNICDIATGQCALATNANLAKVAERTDCDFLSSPSDKGGCGLVTRDELSEFQSEVVDVTNTLVAENAAMQAVISAIAVTLTQMSSQLVPNEQFPPPTSDNPLCKRQLSYNGAPRNPPFSTTAFTNFNLVPLNGGTIACSDPAVVAFTAAVTAQAPKPDSCPLVPKTGGGEYPRVIARESKCQDLGPSYGLPPGKSLWFTMTLSWETRFPCPASPFGRITAPDTPGSDIFGLDGCSWGEGCNPCKPATADGPSSEAICQAIYSAYPSDTVQVVQSFTYLLRESFCEQCVAAGDPYCSPDNRNPYKV